MQTLHSRHDSGVILRSLLLGAKKREWQESEVSKILAVDSGPDLEVESRCSHTRRGMLARLLVMVQRAERSSGLKILEWWPEQGRIRVRFKYDPLLVAEVKQVAGRRWHREDKYWSVPVSSAGEAARILLPLGFEAAPEVEKLLNGEVEGISGLSEEFAVVRESGPGRDQETVASGDPADWSVSRLNHEVQSILRKGFPETVWLVGEIMGVDRSLGRGSGAAHLYFRLVEKDPDGEGSLAEVSAVLWNFKADPSFKAFQSNDTPLEDGLKIRVRVRVDLYMARGQFQAVVEEMDPDYTLGELARRREKILAEVRRLGIERNNLNLPMPMTPLRIGVVTSQGSDAWKDFHDELKSSGYAFQVSLHNARVQGSLAEKDLLRAFQYFAERHDEFDAVVVIRGGGSKTDLMAFDTLELAKAVALHPLKVFVGIGHHADRSVLDELAHSEKTPTAVGQFLVSWVDDSWQQILEKARRIHRSSIERIDRERQLNVDRGRFLVSRGRRAVEIRADEQDRSRVRWQRLGTRALKQERHALVQRVLLWRSRAEGRVSREKSLLRMKREQLQSSALRGVESQGVALQLRTDRFSTLPKDRIEREMERWRARSDRIRSLDPVHILARGFAWVKNAEGQTVRRTGEVEVGDTIVVRLQDGSVDARVE